MVPKDAGELSSRPRLSRPSEPVGAGGPYFALKPVRGRGDGAGRGERSRMSEILNLPVVPMKNAVLLPGVSFPITAGRPATLRAIEAALNDKERRVFAVAQRQVTEGEIVTPDSLYTIGTIATVGSIQRSLGSVLLLLEGKARGIATRFASSRPSFEANRVAIPREMLEMREMLELDSRDPAFVALHHEV